MFNDLKLKAMLNEYISNAEPEELLKNPLVKGLIEAVEWSKKAADMCSVVDDKDAMVLQVAGLKAEESLTKWGVLSE